MVNLKVSEYVLMATIFLSSCHKGPKSAASEEETGTEVELKYATLLRMTDYSDHSVATIINPWDTTKILQEIHIDKPKENAVCLALPHCGLLEMLGCQSKFTDMSNIAVPDAEKIADMDADAILVSPFENSGGYGAIEKLGIDIIQCADYMETSPLGRAEWMKLYGRLFGVKDYSDSLFNVVEKRYLHLTDSAATLVAKNGGKRQSVTFDLITESTWYVPGGNSTVGHLINDAGGNYIFTDRNETGSLALSPETVFDESLNADVWIIRYCQPADLTLNQLGRESIHYSKLKAFKNGNVFGCNLEGSTYFKETSFRPDILLNDFICIVNSAGSAKYFKKIK